MKTCAECGRKAVEVPSATMGVMLIVCQSPSCGHIQRVGEPAVESPTFAQIQREYQGVADPYA